MREPIQSQYELILTNKEGKKKRKGCDSVKHYIVIQKVSKCIFLSLNLEKAETLFQYVMKQTHLSSLSLLVDFLIYI